MSETSENPASASAAAGPSGLFERLTSAKHARLCIALAVVAAALVLFSPALTTHTFVDAEDSVLKLPLVSHVKHVPALFGRQFVVFTDGQYRPFGYAVLAVGRTFVRADNAVFWNLWLLTFHVFNVLLVFAIARMFSRRVEATLVAAALLLVHPQGASFVNQVNLFPQLLGGTLTLACLWCALRHARSGGVGIYVLGLLLFAAAVLSSRSALVLPVLILLVDVLYERKGLVRPLLRAVPHAVIVAAALFAFSVMTPHRMHFLPAPRLPVGAVQYWVYGFTGGNVDELLGLINGRSTMIQLSGLVTHIESTLFLVVASAAVLGVLIASMWGLVSKRWLALGSFLLFLGALPRFGAAQNLTVDYAAWTFRYLPLVGFALLAGAVMDELLRLGGRWTPRVASVATAGVLLVYALMLGVANVRAQTPVRYGHLLLAENPASEIAAVALGKAYLDAGDEKQALAFLFSRLTNTVRANSFAMARYYSRRGEHLAAILHVNNAQQQDDYGLQNQEDQLTRAEVMLGFRAHDFAEQALGHVLMANPCNLRALKMLAEVHAIKGYLRAAVGSLRRAVDLVGDDEEARVRLDELEDRLYYPENYLHTSVVVAPPDPDLLRFVTQQGNPRRIREMVIQLADDHPSDPILLLAAGITLSEIGEQALAAGDRAKASKALDRATQLIDETVARMPRYTYAWASKAWVASNARNPALGVEAVRQARASGLTPRDAKVWAKLGRLAASRRQNQLAIACYLNVLQADPALHKPCGDIGVLYARTGNYEHALMYYEEALRRSDGNDAALHILAGDALRKLGRNDEGIAHFRRAIEIEPLEDQAYRDMGLILGGQKRWTELIAVLEEGLSACPQSTLLRWNLAQVLATVPEDRLRNGPRAVRLAERVRRDANPLTSSHLDVLAMAYAEAGEFGKAVATCTEAVALARADKPGTVRKIEARLERYRQKMPYRVSP